MRKIEQLVRYFYRHTLVRYIFVGGTTFIIDEGLLILLHGVKDVWLPLATFIAYVVAFVYNFSLNRWWAFSAAEANSLKHHIVPYTILFIFNLCFAVIAVSFLSHFINFAIAKVIVVLMQTTWNYITYKNVIFKTAKTVPALE